MSTPCPGRYALCGVPCGCEGRNPSHYPPTRTLVAATRRCIVHDQTYVNVGSGCRADEIAAGEIA